MKAQDNKKEQATDVYTLLTTVNFGKYTGKTIKYIKDADPQYIVWMNGVGYKISDEILIECLANTLPPDDPNGC
jgi:hypothetical protein